MQMTCTQLCNTLIRSISMHSILLHCCCLEHAVHELETLTIQSYWLSIQTTDVG